MLQAQPSDCAEAGTGAIRQPGVSAGSSRYLDGPLRRAADVACAAVVLAAGAPLFAIIAAAIKLDTSGPVLFRQTRVGRHGRPFTILKFRKMPDDLPAQGPMLTARHDPRLTRVGAWLVWLKFDELPQFINVLRGEMSLMGPRPEVPEFVDLEDPRWRTVLSVRPGIFGMNQILCRTESDLYPSGLDGLEQHYRAHILPRKLEVDSDYVRRAGPVYELKLLMRGTMIGLFGSLSRFEHRPWARKKEFTEPAAE